MKKLLFIFLFVVATTNAQNTFSYETGGHVSENGIKLTPTEVREKFIKNYNALEKYDIGRNKKSWGNFFFYGGLVGIGINAYTYQAGSLTAGPEMLIIGGAMVLISIPIKLNYTKRVKESIELMNASTGNKPKTVAYQFNIMPTTNGLALSLHF